jgi:glutaredoxin
MILRAFFAVLVLVTALVASPLQAQQLPFAIARLQKDFPVTLYTSPNCKELCESARGALNKRGVPFTEVQVWNEETVQKLKSVSGSDHLPTLVVGRGVVTGFEQSQFDDLLSSAGYPAAGQVPARNQPAPPVPEGFGNPDAAAAASKPAAPKPAPAPKLGPYDTSGLKGPAPKPGPYDPSGLQGPAPKPGPYGLPAEAK